MVDLWGRTLSRDELLARVGRLEQVAGVQLVECGDGAERGVRVLRVTSGSGFDLEILVDRGFDIGRAWFLGQPLAWWSPVGLVGPWYSEPAGLEWFRGFPGGLLSTCGLDHVQLGGEDDATVFGFPHRPTQTYGLHGRYTGLPARLAGYGTEWRGDEAVLWAEGEVLQASVFAEQLHLRRRIEVDLGGHGVRVRDRVTNIGPTACPHMLLYHCNVGHPVVDEGAELIYPSGPGTCVSEARTADYQTLAAPSDGYAEQCYEHDMAPDGQGWVSAAVVNHAIGLGVYQSYRKESLPHHVTWRQLGRGTYVVAMEPTTNHDAGRFDARARGELLHLSPGEHRDYELHLGVLDGPDEITGFTARSRRLAEAAR